MDKLRWPQHPNSFFTDRLKSKEIRTDPSTVMKIFTKWNVKDYRCEFVHNLERLEAADEKASQQEEPILEEKPVRWVDQNFLIKLSGLRTAPAPIDPPGLFALWCYLEELGIFPVLQAMGLTGGGEEKGYSWFDLFLLAIGGKQNVVGSHKAPRSAGSILAFQSLSFHDAKRLVGNTGHVDVLELGLWRLERIDSLRPLQ